MLLKEASWGLNDIGLRLYQTLSAGLSASHLYCQSPEMEMVTCGRNMVSNNTQLVYSYHGSQGAKETFPTPSHHQQKSGLLTRGRLGARVHAVNTKFSHSTICCFSTNPDSSGHRSFSFVQVKPQICGRRVWSPLCSSPPEATMCCSLTRVVNRGYLINNGLSVRSNL